MALAVVLRRQRPLPGNTTVRFRAASSEIAHHLYWLEIELRNHNEIGIQSRRERIGEGQREIDGLVHNGQVFVDDQHEAVRCEWGLVEE